MADFQQSLQRTLRHEGIYSNNPDDPGGETKYGISRRYHPDVWQRGAPTLEQAEIFYYDHYWRPLNCSSLVSQAVADELFDTAVNLGRKRAVNYLQRAYNRFQGSPAAQLTVDGFIGPITLAAINGWCTRASNETALVHYMDYLQARYYDEHGKDTFLKGWFARRIGTTTGS